MSFVLLLSDLLLLFFRRKRRIDFQHAFGKVHAHLLRALRRRFPDTLRRTGYRTFLPAAASQHDQQRRFARSELNIFNAADIASLIEHHATDQIADVIPARFQLAHARCAAPATRIRPAFQPRKSNQCPRISKPAALCAAKNLRLPVRAAPAFKSRLRQREQLHACGEPIGNVAVNLGRNFAAAALRLHHAGQSNELATCFRIANGPVPCSGAGSRWSLVPVSNR